MNTRNLQKLIRVARGEIPADLVLKGGKVVNVFSGEIQEVDVAISGDQIVGLGSYQGHATIDCRQRFICPGFIDGHLHIESTLLTPANLSAVLLPLGTTTLIADPHEIANVLGLSGIKFMLDNSAGLPLEIYFMAPSCVPATPLETSGAVLREKELRPLRRHPRILGLAEMMNFPGVLMGDHEVLKKLSAFQTKIIDGHAPLLSGKDLCAYLTAGIRSDHECTRLSEAREKLALGMVVMIREDTQANNLKDLLPLVSPGNSRRCLMVTDDRPPEQLAREGHLNAVLKQAVDGGLDPIRAIQMVTLNTAEYFGLRHLGAVAPGYQADIVVLDSLSDITVDSVFKKGKPVAKNGRFPGKKSRPRGSKSLSEMNIKNLHAGRFRIPIRGQWARVIQLVPHQILTRAVRHKVQGREGWLCLSPKEDLVIVACVERHRGTGNIGLGLVTGFGLNQGAIASSVAHDSHNIMVIGREPEEMLLAVKAVKEMKGGLVIVVKGRVEAGLPLPVAGLMSDQSLEVVVERQKVLLQAVSLTGCRLKNPFLPLSFLALPVIPELKITDRGLVDVNRFEIVPLFEK
jgi:adenine deaminase